ncbi:TfoX/Sxy family protein [Parapedobacter sp. DT-150]|uniref:TfoX/Sxy family protein n=1 Tax=Parapedobacter sp. DT-150 TaxID=3396162 RepID=UPI003F194492
MAYNVLLAERVREYLSAVPGLDIREKKMFGGLAFLVNGKMCVNVSEDGLMCRFDPEDVSEISTRKGYLPMVMNGRRLAGYCYVSPEGFADGEDFAQWLELCLAFNGKAKATNARKRRIK